MEGGQGALEGRAVISPISLASPRFNPSYIQTPPPISPPPWCHSQPGLSNTHRLAAFIMFLFISKYFPVQISTFLIFFCFIHC